MRLCLLCLSALMVFSCEVSFAADEETKPAAATGPAAQTGPATQTAPAAQTGPAVEEGWKVIFDGKTLDGWEANESPKSWTVVDGTIQGKGPKSHLFYKVEEFENLEFKADVKARRGSNSGMYFRTAFGPGFPDGYEAQVNNSSFDPKRTGSLYKFVDVKKRIIPDDTWWTQHIIADGNHIVIKINNETVVDYIDEKNTHTKGYLAFQQHDPWSQVQYKNIMVKPLPAKK